MIDKNYDIKALKFGVLIHKDEELSELGTFKNRKDLKIIPFEEVDGLSLNEIRNYLSRKNIYFACYTENSYQQDQDNEKIIKCDLIITIRFGDDYLYDERFDKMVERKLLKHIDTENTSIDLLKIIKCYLKRYRYEDKEEIDKVLELAK